MLWYLPWSENIKKRACRYLLQRYLGNFLEEKLTLDQLSVDLYNGTGTVSDVSLDCVALNELGDAQNWPLEIVDGYMHEITVTIPWSTLLKDDSVVEVNGLYLAVQPKVRPEPVSSMLESMWSSMSSSMQLAEECLRQEDGPPEANPVEGIEMFAHAIDSILSRVKIRFINTKIRIEHVPKNSEKGIALEIHIKNIDYYDEAGKEPPPEVTDPDKTKTYIVSTYTNKRIIFDGVTLYTDEYPSKLRTMARSLLEKSPTPTPEGDTEPDINFQSTTSELFYETKSIISNPESDPVSNESESNTDSFRRDVTPEERANQPDPILFAKLTGRQELGLRIKNSEEAIGPKVDLQMTLGSLIVFLSPRQLNTLLELVDGLNQPHLEDTSNIRLRESTVNMQCKPMRAADFQLVEAQLLGNFVKETVKPSQFNMYGWTGHALDVSELESDRFHPMPTGGGNPMTDSFCSSVSSMTSMTSSVYIPQAQPRIKRNKKVPQIDGDPTAEVSHINIKILSCSCILLHKDILTSFPVSTDCVTAASAKRMHEASVEFFEKLGLYSVGGHARKHFEYADRVLDNATRRSHLRLITSAITLDGSEKTTSHGSQTNCEVHVTHILLKECLFDKHCEENKRPESFDLIRFDWRDEDEDDSDTTSTSVAQPCVRINFKQTLKYMKVSGEKKLLYPTTDINIKCLPFQVNVDLTVLDRVWWRYEALAGAPRSATADFAQNQLNLTLHVARVEAVLRFPELDLRPGVDREVRRVRDDYVLFNFQDVLVNSQQSASARPLPTTVAIRATTIDLFYYENESAEGIHIARAGMNDAYDPNILRSSTSALPTISLTFQPSKPEKGPFDPLSDEEQQYDPPPSNPMTTSMYIMDKLRSVLPSPFSSKKSVHQSVTKHEDSPNGQGEELIVPGNEEEMSEFTSHCVEQSEIHLDLSLPILSLQLESKQLYEIIYNRMNADLLLWEPHVKDPYEIAPPAFTNQNGEPSIYPTFSMCKNAGYDSDDQSTSSDEDNVYLSTCDTKYRSKRIPNKPSVEKRDTHNFCFTLKVAKGLLSIYSPVRDSNKRVIPGQMGSLAIDVGKLSMCQVSGLNGVLKTAQMCLRANTATLYHDPLQTIPTEKPPLRLYGTSLPSHLKETIYPSTKGVLLKDNIEKKDMFTLALNVEPQIDVPNFKKIVFALGIEGATLRHRGEHGISWLSQLLDVLDVTDAHVPGYRPSVVLTELHAHLHTIAIHYRPLYLPIQTVLTLGSFSVSSNLIAQSNTSCLRFLAQDCKLFLNVVSEKSKDVPPDIHRDFVCVCDVGLFELSLRMQDKKQSNGPHVDLSASNNQINIHTCWDSASALCRLVTYLAADGDFRNEDGSLDTTIGFEDFPEEIREISPDEQQQVYDLVAEAMKESPNATCNEEELSATEKEGVEVFYFPDESNSPVQRKSSETQESDSVEADQTSLEYMEAHSGTPELAEEAKPVMNDQVAKELGDPNASPKATPQKPPRSKKKSSGEGSTTDDEYCIVENQPSIEDDELAEPTVVWLDSSPVPLVENHFTVPLARTDVLKAPRSFPQPVLRYTLHEMSVYWHIYDGHDFSTSKHAATTNKNVTIEEHATDKCTIDYEPYEVNSTSAVRYRHTSGRTRREPRGPKQRDTATQIQIALTKVKFQHESYGGGGTHASRQTLAISNLEILDRLASSHINKFLSRLQLDEEPERNNAHMLVIKAVHLRPEPALPAQECCLKISLLPLRFHIDQDTLAFLIAFFSKLGSDDAPEEDDKSLSGVSVESNSSKQATPTHRPPVMSVNRQPDTASLNDTSSVNEEEPLMESYEAERLISDNLIQLEEEFQLSPNRRPSTTRTTTESEPSDDEPIYFRRVVFSPEVPIRLDYLGKRVDLSAGPVAGLIMGLGQLNCSELRLKRLSHRHGLLGLEKLVKWALKEWLTDIKRNQLPGLLSGIGPMHSLLQFVRGIRDLLWLPVEQWRRDGRLVHGLRRGAASFSARTAVAALDMSSRLLRLIQATAETAFDMLTPAATLQLRPTYERREQRRRRQHDPARHPADLRDAVAAACLNVREGMSETATTLAIAVRTERGAALRHVPGAMVAPLALAAAGACDVLGGVRCALAPRHRRTHADKWRRTHESTE